MIIISTYISGIGMNISSVFYLQVFYRYSNLDVARREAVWSFLAAQP